MLKPNQPHISTYCGTTACVEAELNGQADKVTVRDAKDSSDECVTFDVEAFGAFVAAVKRGRFDG